MSDVGGDFGGIFQSLRSVVGHRHFPLLGLLPGVLSNSLAIQGRGRVPGDDFFPCPLFGIFLFFAAAVFHGGSGATHEGRGPIRACVKKWCVERVWECFQFCGM